MTDYRFVWLRDRISKILGVHDHPDALETLIKDHHDAFIAFLDAEIVDIKETEKCLLFIYRTFYDRLVEKEVVTIEKGERAATKQQKNFSTFNLHFFILPSPYLTICVRM